MANSDPRGGRRLGSNYPPLAVAALMLIILLSVLPSALDLPQSNPSETLEYAPVPPEDEAADDPPRGNFSALGLGSSGSVGSAGAGDAVEGAGGEADFRGRGKNPSTKRCVGNPPRQTEDPASPPCVAYFAGNNFGATYQGVTTDEVRVLLVAAGNFCYASSSGLECGAPGSYYDLADPPKDDDPLYVRIARTYQRYFNERYQTYGRFVHFFVYYDGATTAEERRANAAENYRRIKPFAAFDIGALLSFGNEFVDAVARRGVLNFGTATGRSDVYFRKYPDLLWGYPPTIEQSAQRFVSYLCRRVVDRPVSFSGVAADMGEPRKYGLLYTDDPLFPEVAAFTKLVRDGFEACGGSFAEVRTNPPNACIASGPSYSQPEYATTNMAAFQAAGVTTIIWTQCWEMNNTHAAASANYYPEWVIAGDSIAESSGRGQQQNPDAMSQAWIVSHVTLEGEPSTKPCYQAQREADPSAPELDVVTYGCSFNVYESLRQLFTGIQVAGPRLSPATMSRGFRAIPARASTAPSLAACFYRPNDYSCVKDGVAMWWDPNGEAPSSVGATGRGCWRMPEGGRRILEGNWEPEDVTARQRADDPCNQYNQ